MPLSVAHTLACYFISSARLPPTLLLQHRGHEETLAKPDRQMGRISRGVVFGGRPTIRACLRLQLDGEICNRLSVCVSKTQAPLPVAPAFIEDFENHNIHA